MARFYLCEESLHPVKNDSLELDVINPSLYSNNTLVAWGTIPLYVQRAGTNRMNVGTHQIRLFVPPVPESNDIPLSSHGTSRNWTR